MSWILTYLIIGVAINFVYDWLVSYTGEEHRFTMKERIMVGLSWPVFLVMFTYYFIKTFLSGKY